MGTATFSADPTPQPILIANARLFLIAKISLISLNLAAANSYSFIERTILMSQQKPHDLFDFMWQISEEMSSEYRRIQNRAKEDPGTAGDQGEENWATLLRDWLPGEYQVVTKGRIISHDGIASPQIDVLVLKGSYPKKMLDKKLYLAAGVAAAFECKVTLKASHIPASLETCAKVKSLYRPRLGTPYRELHSPVLYGLLAHSHSWKGENSDSFGIIKKTLLDGDAKIATHPRLQLDLLCVADFALWKTSYFTFWGPRATADYEIMAPLLGADGSATSCYVGNDYPPDQTPNQSTPIGGFISHLSQRLAWENPSFRDLAEYYRLTTMLGSGAGELRKWPSSIYSEEIRAQVENGAMTNGVPWDEWANEF